MQSNPPSTACKGPAQYVRCAIAVCERFITHNIIALGARISLAAIFWFSGRTKVAEGTWLSLSDSAIFLFREEYNLPLIPPEFAAHMAMYAEHLFPILLVLGLATRFAALSLLGMTAVIQIFVYPDAWPTHLSWATLMLVLLAKGGGQVAIDRCIAQHCQRD